MTISGNSITFANAGSYSVVESVTDNTGITSNSLPVTITVSTPTTPSGGGNSGSGNTGAIAPAAPGIPTGPHHNTLQQLHEPGLCANKHV